MKEPEPEPEPELPPPPPPPTKVDEVATVLVMAPVQSGNDEMFAALRAMQDEEVPDEVRL